jgi:hypothetical protein
MPDTPRSPASRLLQILRTPKVAGVARINRFCVRRRLPVLPGSTGFAYAGGARCCPDQPVSRTPKVAGVARINRFCVRRRCPVLHRINRFCVRRRLPVLYRINRFRVRRRSPVLPRIDRFRIRRRLPALRVSTVGARLPANAVSLTHGGCLTTAFANKPVQQGDGPVETTNIPDTRR